MGKTKKLLELSQKSCSELVKQNEELRKQNREYEELLKFIEWLNTLCMKNQYTFCGIKKIKEEGFIGFVLVNRVAIEPETHYQYDLYGYSYRHMKECEPVYKAYFKQYDDPAYAEIKKHLYIQDHMMRNEMKGKGIGSVGMDMAKELAKHLRCAYISGERKANPNTEEEREKLYRFYEKNGFQQSQNKDDLYIKYDMKLYEEEKEQKEKEK